MESIAWWLRLLTILTLQNIYKADGVSTEELRERLRCQQTTGTDGSKNSFLWTVRRNPPAYFFGTIHVPYSRVWDYIPENTKLAFHQSDNIFFELDLTDPYTISALTNCQMLPHGENLSNVLPKNLYLRLKRHLEYVKLMMPTWMTADQRGIGLYADFLFNAIAGNWEHKRPVWVMLMVNSLTESDIKSRGVPVLDLFLAHEAKSSNKRTGAVERVEEQCRPLNGLNISQVLFALNQTLWQQEILRAGESGTSYTTEDLIRHYNCGDLNSVIFNQDTAQVPKFINVTVGGQDVDIAENIDEYFRQELIYKRNYRMAARVRDLLETYPDRSFFFAFGAGHFLGNNTVIEILQNDGYSIEHVSPDEDLRKMRRRWRKENTHPDPLLSTVNKSRRRNKNRDREGSRRRKRRRHERVNHNRENTRQFNDLWVPLDDASQETTTRPSAELNSQVTMATTPQLSHSIYFIYMANGNSCIYGLNSLSLILCIIFSLWFNQTLFITYE
ncbi:metalloprotease TIKI1-like [Ptychodera flava]|uniref:metalloprotease TIKI1-like n=1 Tax=Ptychodera flava TaxID=63121 RepID=UPI00396A1C68